MIAVSRLGLHPLIAVSRSEIHPLIAVSRLGLHVALLWRIPIRHCSPKGPSAVACRCAGGGPDTSDGFVAAPAISSSAGAAEALASPLTPGNRPSDPLQARAATALAAMVDRPAASSAPVASWLLPPALGPASSAPDGMARAPQKKGQRFPFPTRNWKGDRQG